MSSFTNPTTIVSSLQSVGNSVTSFVTSQMVFVATWDSAQYSWDDVLVTWDGNAMATLSVINSNLTQFHDVISN